MPPDPPHCGKLHGDCLAVQFAKPTFYQVQPTGSGGDEVEYEARMALQPRSHVGVFAGAVVIHDEHLVETFKLSRDPKFLEKMTDVVGLYLNPPQQAMVLCVDEKSQIQALDRTQPGLPLKKGRCGTMTHDYKRNGTTTLFAALEMLQGKVIGQCYQRHRHQEFLRFLRTLDSEFPGKVPLHGASDCALARCY